MDEQRTETNNKVGIGGWLILVLIGLIITPIRVGITLFRDIFPLFDSMAVLEAYPKLQTMVYMEAIVNISFGVCAIILLIMMINKKRRFPKLMIIFYVSNLFFVLADAFYASQLPELEQLVTFADSTKEIIRAVVGTAIWVPYMLISTRVKQTFVE